MPTNMQFAGPAGSAEILGRVLVVEANPAVRHSARRALHGAGAVVDTASTERQALGRMMQQQYSVVVCSTSLPGSRAFELVREAKRLGSQALFVLLDEDPHFERVSEQVDEAIVGVLRKPVIALELVELVRRASAVASKRRPPSIAPGPGHTTPGPVLILEDNPGDTELIRTCLQEMGYDPRAVTTARRVKQALELLGQRHFVLAIVDMNLPDATGLDVVRQVYACDSNLAIVVASGGPMDLTEQALACGAQEVASKAGLFDELPAAITRGLLRKAADRDVRYRATHDSMTGLFNRTRFIDALERAVARARRKSSTCAVVYIDLDGFKPINDRHGHAAGDTALKVVASRLSQAIRETDSAARLGGDEFSILVEDVNDGAGVRPLAQRILRVLAEPIALGDGTDVRIAGSLGIAMFPESGSSPLELMDAADAAMFSAKDAGGHQYCFAAPLAEFQETGSRSRLAIDLKDGLANSEFYLMFQPQVDLTTHGVVGLEALLRWKRRVGATVGPDEFVPILEQTGMILDVGAWVLREACRCASQWGARHGHARPVRVAVNVSPLQLEQASFVSYVEQVLNDSALDPDLLELEITETTLMRDTGTIQQALASLRAMGVRLVLDDFGTGYASLSYLRRYPVDGLKIDRSFIEALMTESTSRVLVGAIIELAHQLNIEVVAEGVEHLAQVRYLRERGCDSCQGFMFGRPHFLGDSRSSGIWVSGSRASTRASEPRLEPVRRDRAASDH
jgi:diguanylate cyclase (GGDEF)-like protein